MEGNDLQILIEYIRSATTVQSNVVSNTETLKQAMATLSTNYGELKTLLTEMNAAQKEFRKTTMRLLVGFIIILALIISGLMIKLNIEGGDVIKNVIEQRGGIPK